MWKRLVTIIGFFLAPQVNPVHIRKIRLATTKTQRDAQDVGRDGAHAGSQWEGQDPALQTACLLTNTERCR